MLVFDGLILTVLEDFGPAPVVNLSNLDEATATHLSITGMTIVGLGSTRVYLRLFGHLLIGLPFMEYIMRLRESSMNT